MSCTASMCTCDLSGDYDLLTGLGRGHAHHQSKTDKNRIPRWIRNAREDVGLEELLKSAKAEMDGDKHYSKRWEECLAKYKKQFVSLRDLHDAFSISEMNEMLRDCRYPPDVECPIEKQLMPLLLVKRAEELLITPDSAKIVFVELALEDLESITKWGGDEVLPVCLSHKLKYLKFLCLTKLRRFDEAERECRAAIRVVGSRGECTGDLVNTVPGVKDKMSKCLSMLQLASFVRFEIEREVDVDDVPQHIKVPDVEVPNCDLPHWSDAVKLEVDARAKPGFPLSLGNARKLLAQREIIPGEVLCSAPAAAFNHADKSGKTEVDHFINWCPVCLARFDKKELDFMWFVPCPGCRIKAFCSYACKDKYVNSLKSIGGVSAETCLALAASSGFLKPAGFFYQDVVPLTLRMLFSVPLEDFKTMGKRSDVERWTFENPENVNPLEVAFALEGSNENWQMVRFESKSERERRREWRMATSRVAAAAMALWMAERAAPDFLKDQNEEELLMMLLRVVHAISFNKSGFDKVKQPHIYLDPFDSKLLEHLGPVHNSGSCRGHREYLSAAAKSRDQGVAFFPSAAVAGRSCLPNASAFQVGGRKIIVARQIISKGDEISVEQSGVDWRDRPLKRLTTLLFRAGMVRCGCPDRKCVEEVTDANNNSSSGGKKDNKMKRMIESIRKRGHEDALRFHSLFAKTNRNHNDRDSAGIYWRGLHRKRYSDTFSKDRKSYSVWSHFCGGVAVAQLAAAQTVEYDNVGKDGAKAIEAFKKERERLRKEVEEKSKCSCCC